MHDEAAREAGVGGVTDRLNFCSAVGSGGAALGPGGIQKKFEGCRAAGGGSGSTLGGASAAPPIGGRGGGREDPLCADETMGDLWGARRAVLSGGRESGNDDATQRIHAR